MFTKFDTTKLFDSHCHLNFPELAENAEEVVANAKEAGLSAIIDMADDAASAKLSVALAAKHDIVYASVGIDPQVLVPGGEYYNEAYLSDKYVSQEIEKIQNLLSEDTSKIAMIGEIGMDNYWLKKARADGQISAEQHEIHLKKQEELFRIQLELAVEVGLPVSVHSRGHEESVVDIIREYDVRGILHSYTGDYQAAKKALDHGWGIGVNGIITYKNAESVREVIKKITGDTGDFSPADLYQKGIYLETDAPFLIPAKSKLKTRYNQPKTVVEIFQYIVEFL